MGPRVYVTVGTLSAFTGLSPSGVSAGMQIVVKAGYAEPYQVGVGALIGHVYVPGGWYFNGKPPGNKDAFEELQRAAHAVTLLLSKQRSELNDLGAQLGLFRALNESDDNYRQRLKKFANKEPP